MDYFLIKNNKAALQEFKCGIEREALRISGNGEISKKNHPISLGSPLTNKMISLDFADQQIELNTTTLASFTSITDALEQLHQFVLSKIDDELLWPYSMPPSHEYAKIANFGISYGAKKKMRYRKGLVKRYGTSLQLISGIHFNF